MLGCLQTTPAFLGGLVEIPWCGRVFLCSDATPPCISCRISLMISGEDSGHLCRRSVSFMSCLHSCHGGVEG